MKTIFKICRALYKCKVILFIANLFFLMPFLCSGVSLNVIMSYFLNGFISIKKASDLNITKLIKTWFCLFSRIYPYYSSLCFSSVPVLSFFYFISFRLNKRKIELIKRDHSQVFCFGGRGAGRCDRKKQISKNLQSCVSVLPRNSWENAQPYSLRTKVDFLSSGLLSNEIDHKREMKLESHQVQVLCLNQ